MRTWNSGPAVWVPGAGAMESATDRVTQAYSI
jgi:hypothetical protein